MDLKMNYLYNKLFYFVIYVGYKGWDIIEKIYIKLY